jgi:hypothetical protein
MRAHRAGEFRGALRPGRELIGQPELGCRADGS